jgi:hypothetical protein
MHTNTLLPAHEVPHYRLTTASGSAEYLRNRGIAAAGGSCNRQSENINRKVHNHAAAAAGRAAACRSAHCV